MAIALHILTESVSMETQLARVCMASIMSRVQPHVEVLYLMFSTCTSGTVIVCVSVHVCYIQLKELKVFAGS